MALSMALASSRAALTHRAQSSADVVSKRLRFLQGTPLCVSRLVRPTSKRAGLPSIYASAERFHLWNLGPQPGSRKKNQRKGRGRSAGQGGSCGFGMRGQQSRSGPGVRPGFEGGQTPLYRRLPKLRGIAGGMGAGLPKFVTVNLSDIESAGFHEGEEVSLESLKIKRIINPSGREARLRLKILGDGELRTKVSVKAGSFSSAAKTKLESAGCTLLTVPGRKKWVRPSVARSRARTAEFFAKKFGTSNEASAEAAAV